MCDCAICVRDKTVVKRLQRMRPEARKFWEAIYMDLAHAEMDRDVNAAVIDGSWTDADKIIEHARNRGSA